MGLFDKLKGVASGAKAEAAAPKEDLSGLDIMGLAEKIDEYNTEFFNSKTSASFAKLENAVEEIKKKVQALPLAKRANLSTCVTGLETSLTMIRNAMKMKGPQADAMLAGAKPTMDSSLGALVTVISKDM